MFEVTTDDETSGELEDFPEDGEQLSSAITVDIE